ncbi:922a0ae4-a96a-484f-b143-9093439c4d6d [Thermothielavioides terrestris]|uniref:922a0ae4-a96a-484f-b143-9093439c4d6d n=1 Tax=Thermothielavioides terrestris TaxID=2587410 RepID=A0A3S4AVS8_9PEZI|nr:922a0ae4-a96a-484f-b143-9093439c4d6d [Thermothielavioides terrestris]
MHRASLGGAAQVDEQKLEVNATAKCAHYDFGGAGGPRSSHQPCALLRYMTLVFASIALTG